MSETSEVLLKRPPVPERQKITDSLGRVLTVQKLDALAELDLIEAAGGQNASNARWMMMATFAACVVAIDTVPSRPLAKRDHIREHMRRVGTEGINAVIAWLQPESLPDEAPDGDDTAATAKNSVGTP